MKHLWEYYDNIYLFETEINHKAKNPYYSSWAEFIELGKSALKCNCTNGKPLVWWYWQVTNTDDPDGISDNKSDSESDTDSAIDSDIDSDIESNSEAVNHFLNLIFGYWNNNISRFVIKVNKEDEVPIREFIKAHQGTVKIE